jgi:hypothetical protein
VAVRSDPLRHDHVGTGHEDMIRPRDVRTQVRQIAITGIGRDEPTLLITDDVNSSAKDLFTRYAERMLVENELAASIGRFHLDALTAAVPLNVDLDTIVTVVAGNLYRLFARQLPRYQHATPDRIWRHFLAAIGTLHITDTGVTCALNLRSHDLVLIDAGFADLAVPIHWWNGCSVVLEGAAGQVTDDAELKPVAEAFAAKYGTGTWGFVVRDGAFSHRDLGGRSLVFRLRPVRGLGFGKGHRSSRTTWPFPS